jgi:predicted enzyme related to lactoylglutathione lyase
MIQRNTPEIFVRSVDEAIRFYTETLGFELEGRMPEDQTKPVEWAMVANGNASFMFQRPDSPRQADGVVFYLAVDDADATIEELRNRGASVEGPVDQFYGYREATVTDPSGYKLVFTSPIPAPHPAGEEQSS